MQSWRLNKLGSGFVHYSSSSIEAERPQRTEDIETPWGRSCKIRGFTGMHLAHVFQVVRCRPYLSATGASIVDMSDSLMTKAVCNIWFRCCQL
jgi:hypothetical protein